MMQGYLGIYTQISFFMFHVKHFLWFLHMIKVKDMSKDR